MAVGVFLFIPALVVVRVLYKCLPRGKTLRSLFVWMLSAGPLGGAGLVVTGQPLGDNRNTEFPFPQLPLQLFD